MMPRIANAFKEGTKEQVKAYMEKSIAFVVFLAFPIILGLISTSKIFVPIFFGEGYDKVSILINIMSLTVLFLGLTNILGTQYLIPTNRQKEYTIAVLIGFVANTILNIILIQKYQSIGATIATIIAECLVLGIQLYYLRNEIKLREILNISKKYIFSSIIMFFLCIGLKQIPLRDIVLPISQIVINANILMFIMQVIIGAVVYLLILIILKDKYVNFYVDTVINRILKRNV